MYKYDDRGRCIEKQLPGCEPVKYWYDNANRLQSEQDGHLRSQSLYRNYRYDAIGRLTLQTISGTRGVASENNAKAVEVKNYYDDYTTCLSELSYPFSIWADSISSRCAPSTMTRGRQTATLHTTSDGKKYFEIYRYDTKGRVVNQLSAYSDKWLKSVHTSYNFVGDVSSALESVYTHQEYQKVLLARRRIRNTYYPGTRLLKKTLVSQVNKNGGGSGQYVNNYTYDVFGNIVGNNRPGTAADMTYSYDTLHGWLKGISSPSGFSEQLLREDATVPLFSGNIGSMQWRNTSNGEQHRYDYTYDGLGRLTHSDYSSSALGTEGRFDETVSYNPNGSIETLLRSGMKNDGTFGTIDNLAISYDGNRLLKVTDNAEAVNYNGSLDFHDGADTECEYEYDSNGALKKDSNRGIKSITYDYGHHPYFINMNQVKKSNNITNDYTPDGRKLSSSHKITIANANGYTRKTTTDLYIDGLIVRDGTPLLWQFDGGYVDLDANGAPTSWNYYVTDHLGSTRMVVDSKNNIKETISYYPFGSEMRIQEPGQLPQLADAGSHPFRFTGKELDRQNGLNMYDFGARWFDVAGVPMWTSVDPLAEKNPSLTPYHFCHNDPVNRTDSDGKWDVNVHLAKDRRTNGYGVAVISDRNGQEIFRFIVRAEGVKGHDRMKTGGDTPLGTYDIPNNNAWTNGKSRLSYGPNDRLVMNPESGEIVESGRNEIRIHGGRQEIQNPDGTWQRKENAKLEKTFGCLRASDEDMKTFKTFTDYLESTDDQETPGKVFVKDDFERFNKKKDE